MGPLQPASPPSSLRQSPHHCPCPWVMHICSSATRFPMQYFISPWLFYNNQFVLLNPFTYPPDPAPIWQPSKSFLYLWVGFLLFLFSSGTPMMWMFVHLKLSQRLLLLSSFFLDSFFSLLFWMIVFLLPYILNSWFDSQFYPLLLLISYKLFFISVSVSFISDWIFLCCWGPH